MTSNGRIRQARYGTFVLASFLANRHGRRCIGFLFRWRRPWVVEPQGDDVLRPPGRLMRFDVATLTPSQVDCGVRGAEGFLHRVEGAKCEAPSTTRVNYFERVECVDGRRTSGIAWIGWTST